MCVNATPLHRYTRVCLGLPDSVCGKQADSTELRWGGRERERGELGGGCSLAAICEGLGTGGPVWFHHWLCSSVMPGFVAL